MSVAKLLLSGLLVASGLVLGAFTLHGYFDPQWLERQAAGAGRRSPAGVPSWTTSIENRSRVMSVVSEGTGPSPPAKPASKADAKADGKPDAKPPSQAADAEKAGRRLAAKKLAEKRKAEEARKAQEAQKAEAAKGPQQATFQWPWNWFGN